VDCWRIVANPDRTPQKDKPQGLKPAEFYWAFCGTTEVVPCYKARLKNSAWMVGDSDRTVFWDGFRGLASADAEVASWQVGGRFVGRGDQMDP
jgi:hypothetical protein